MRANDGVWLGWPGGTDQDLEPFEDDGLALHPMSMSAEDIEGHYEGFSNSTVWPLYHDLVAKPEFHREWWDSYVEVNQRFADKAAELANEGALVWVHDYQMQLVPQMLRHLRPDLRIGFFLHIAFPPTELFQQLPWRCSAARRAVGRRPGWVPTARWRRQLCPTRPPAGGPQRRTAISSTSLMAGPCAPRRSLFLIDNVGFSTLAQTPEVTTRAKEVRSALGDPSKIFLGVDRLDYTKGIYARLRAYAELLEDGELDVEDAVFVQVANPSRESIRQYQALRSELEELIGHINGELGRIGRPAISYMYSSHSREEMAALLRAADVMVVTPLRDGMNLIAKEYVAVRNEDAGALVLSEFAERPPSCVRPGWSTPTTSTA